MRGALEIGRAIRVKGRFGQPSLADAVADDFGGLSKATCEALEGEVWSCFHNCPWFARGLFPRGMLLACT